MRRLIQLAVIAVLLSPTAHSQSGDWYVITTVAGAAKLAGDGGPATAARLFWPGGVALDGEGNLYIADTRNHRIRKVTPGGVIQTVAGSEAGFGGNGGPATSAQLSGPSAVAVSSTGDLYIADTSNHCIRRVTPDGVIHAFAGTGVGGFSGDGGPALSARFSYPGGLAFDSTGALYVADTRNHRIRKITQDGLVQTVAGTGAQGFSGDGEQATAAQLKFPIHVMVGPAGNLYICDQWNHRVRKVATDGVISTVAGSGTVGYGGDGGPATSAQFNGPASVALDGSGNLFIVDSSNHCVRKVSAAGTITTVAGGLAGGYSGDGGPALDATMYIPSSLVIDAAGSFYIADSGNHRIRMISPASVMTTAAGSGHALGDGGPATAAHLTAPADAVLDDGGDLYIADAENNRIRKVATDGNISTVAGTGVYGYGGDGGPAAAAKLSYPVGLALDGAGNLYISDQWNYRVRMITPGGVISTVAGSGTAGYSGDGGPATSAQLRSPEGLATDEAGNLYIADRMVHRIRKVTPGGTISTVAGTGTLGFSGDGSPATSAQLNSPYGVAVDAAGNLYIADTGNRRVRKVSPQGTITTVAGDGTWGSGGDGGPATAAQFDTVDDVSVDASGNLYIADRAAHRIRRVSPSGVITTIAGDGVAGFRGDDGLATRARLWLPGSVKPGDSGSLYIADTGNYRVRKLTPVQIVPEGVVNAASFAAGAVSPGELIAIYGSEIGPATPVKVEFNQAGFLEMYAGETTVLFDGIAAPLTYVSAGQINAVVPYGLAGKTSTQLEIDHKGEKTNAISLPVAESAPGIFTTSWGTGQGVIVNLVDQQWTLNSPSNPAARDSIVIIYATGEGQTDPAGVDGKRAVEVYPKPLLAVSVTVGGQDAEIVYAGAAPLFVAGLFNVYIKVPPGVTPGDALPVVLKVGNNVSQPGVTMAVK